MIICDLCVVLPATQALVGATFTFQGSRGRDHVELSAAKQRDTKREDGEAVVNFLKSTESKIAPNCMIVGRGV